MEQKTTLKTYHMVMGADLNPRDNLYAGSCARYMVETGFLTVQAFLDSPHIVCFGLTGMKFLKPVKKGTSVCFTGYIVYTGKTSVGVYMELTEMLGGSKAAEAYLTFVHIEEATQRPTGHGKTLENIDPELLPYQKRYAALKSVRG
ncbi:MAG: acyl-CoA thioesterase [Acidaminococcus sp.]|jgi:acyl-CoA hydrolase|nr:acyl-CoA thioesterase [Acidaminococcus sp.]MCI2100725.1 acyl-CoA thioesterase [Acidaminococcus sp.]MCI2115046.1 acyl-CoA thioesterase [Acidaminococcus sp.]MCI2117122.1 acyl-CoA thioesterase [Acidaminococcus sp.]